MGHLGRWPRMNESSRRKKRLTGSQASTALAPRDTELGTKIVDAARGRPCSTLDHLGAVSLGARLDWSVRQDEGERQSRSETPAFSLGEWIQLPWSTTTSNTVTSHLISPVAVDRLLVTFTGRQSVSRSVPQCTC